MKIYPNATIVNPSCDLDETGKACDNGLCHIMNVDFWDVIAVHKQMIARLDREENIACDLNDYSWIDQIDDDRGVILFPAGVFHCKYNFAHTKFP